MAINFNMNAKHFFCSFRQSVDNSQIAKHSKIDISLDWTRYGIATMFFHRALDFVCRLSAVVLAYFLVDMIVACILFKWEKNDSFSKFIIKLRRNLLPNKVDKFIAEMMVKIGDLSGNMFNMLIKNSFRKHQKNRGFCVCPMKMFSANSLFQFVLSLCDCSFNYFHLSARNYLFLASLALFIPFHLIGSSSFSLSLMPDNVWFQSFTVSDLICKQSQFIYTPYSFSKHT